MHRKTDWSENRKDDKGEMSFSGMVKEELSRQIGLARHCKMAELAAILCSCGKMECFSGDSKLKIQTENEAVARKCFTLLQKTFNIETDVSNSRIDRFRKGNLYCISIIDQFLVKEILDSAKALITEQLGDDREIRDAYFDNTEEGVPHNSVDVTLVMEDGHIYMLTFYKDGTLRSLLYLE